MKTFLALCLCVAVLGALGPAARAEDGDRLRPYLGLRFMDTLPTGVHDLYGFSLGVNLNRYLGVELAGDRYEVFPDISPYGTIGEYGVLALIPQLRLRYPVFQDRLVPYVLGGVGAAIGQFNDRKPRGFGLSITGGNSAAVAGTIGAGIEYFVADNIALGIEARYLFAPDATLTVQGEPRKVSISGPLISVGMRMFYPEWRPAPMAEAREDVPVRLYIGGRAGGAVVLDSDLIPGLEAEPTNNAIGGVLSKAFGASLGLNIGRYLGVELAGDGYEVNLNLKGTGVIGEYAVYTLIPTVRVRYPLAGDRLQPYALAGVGYGHAEWNDRKPPGADLSVDASSSSWAMALGAGVEYFVTSNIALGLETKWLYSPGHAITIGSGPTRDATLSTLLFSVSFRAFLFDFPAWKSPAPARSAAGAGPGA